MFTGTRREHCDERGKHVAFAATRHGGARGGGRIGITWGQTGCEGGEGGARRGLTEHKGVGEQGGERDEQTSEAAADICKFRGL